MIAVRQEGDFLTNDAGEVTSHLLGMFHRTIRMVDQGIKPVWVFDGQFHQSVSFIFGFISSFLLNIYNDRLNQPR